METVLPAASRQARRQPSSICCSSCPLPRPAPPPRQVEMILQALEYESAQGMSLQEFFDSTAGKWRTDIGRSWAEEIVKRRAARQ